MINYTGNINDLMLLIKHEMLNNDIKQKDICLETKWSKATVSNLLNCRTENISLTTLQTLCNACKCDLFIDIKSHSNQNNNNNNND